jgi:hypothetical protein
MQESRVQTEVGLKVLSAESAKQESPGRKPISANLSMDFTDQCQKISNFEQGMSNFEVFFHFCGSKFFIRYSIFKIRSGKFTQVSAYVAQALGV